jgi:hypothetical protein
MQNGLFTFFIEHYHHKMSVSTQDNASVNMRGIIRDIKRNVLPNAELTYKIRYLGENIWSLRILRPNMRRSARIEIIIDEFNNPDDRGARGAVFTYGDIPRHQVSLIMDSIMERI